MFTPAHAPTPSVPPTNRQEASSEVAELSRTARIDANANTECSVSSGVGAEGTFREQLGTVAPILRRRALLLTRDPNRADDLVQDTIERALRFEHTYQPGTNLAGWLSRVMYSVFMSRCRRNQVEGRVLRTLWVDPNAWQKTTADGIRQPWLSPRIESALGSLPEKLSAVVRLIDLGEFTYSEAAEALDVPVGTVMSRLHRARKRLATALEETTEVSTAAAA